MEWRSPWSDMKVSVRAWHTYSVTLPLAFGLQMGYRIMPHPDGDSQEDLTNLLKKTISWLAQANFSWFLWKLLLHLGNFIIAFLHFALPHQDTIRPRVFFVGNVNWSIWCTIIYARLRHRCHHETAQRTRMDLNKMGGFICTFSLLVSLSITLQTSKFRNQFTISSKYFDMACYLKSETYPGPISFEVQRNDIWTDNIQSFEMLF